jgi:hypothetical protein
MSDTILVSTIEEMVESLASIEDQSALVYIDNRPPTALSSYRGYYEDLAIERDVYGLATDRPGFSETRIPEKSKPFHTDMFGTYTPGIQHVEIRRNPDVREVIKAFNLALYEQFEGYKGGQFTMHPNTDLWVSEYGDVDGLRIVGVEVLPGRVDFVTKELRGY